MEPCAAFTPWHDKATGKTTLRYKDGKCLHYYFYVLDKEFGLCYLRVPTWAPFRVQCYGNGHNWLAGQLRQAGIAAEPLDNTFGTLGDSAKAQARADASRSRGCTTPWMRSPPATAPSAPTSGWPITGACCRSSTPPT